MIATAIYNRRDISEFIVGKVVENQDQTLIGHVVGLSMNAFNEVIVVVRWCNDTEYAVHPTNLRHL